MNGFEPKIWVFKVMGSKFKVKETFFSGVTSIDGSLLIATV